MDREGEGEGKRDHRPAGAGYGSPGSKQDEGAGQQCERDVEEGDAAAQVKPEGFGEHHDEDEVDRMARPNEPLDHPKGPFRRTTAKFRKPASVTHST